MVELLSPGLGGGAGGASWLQHCFRQPTSCHFQNLLELLFDLLRRQDFSTISGNHLHMIVLPLPGGDEKREGMRRGRGRG